MTPQISAGNPENSCMWRNPSLTYRLGESTITGKVDDKIEAVKQAVYHILMTERYSSPIYDDDYGVELEQYQGKDIGFIAAGIESTLKEALLQDDRITDVQVNSVEESKVQSGACVIKFTVSSIYGNIEETLNVIQ